MIMMIIIIIVSFLAFAIIINITYSAFQSSNFASTHGVIWESAKLIFQYCTQILPNVLLTCPYFVIKMFSSNFMSLKKDALF
jgi:hypothetical protein